MPGELKTRSLQVRQWQPTRAFKEFIIAEPRIPTAFGLNQGEFPMDDNGKSEARYQSVSRRRLLKNAATVGLTSAGTAIFAPTIVHAQNAGCGEFTLDKIKRSSQFSVGARQGVFPFGYLDKDNNWTGISTEIAREVRKNIEKELKTEVKLNLVAVTSQTRIPLLLKWHQ
jgi:hypothetical protein